jgi:hypothetical protein
VINFPGSIGTTFDVTSAVYVEKVNRIYIFGGETNRNGNRQAKDSIWYINLHTLPQLDCSNLTCGSDLR